MSAILHEQQSLRAEVRQVACLRDEISALKIELEAVRSRCAKEQLDDGDFPPLPSVEAYMKTAAIPPLPSWSCQRTERLGHGDEESEAKT